MCVDDDYYDDGNEGNDDSNDDDGDFDNKDNLAVTMVKLLPRAKICDFQSILIP